MANNYSNNEISPKVKTIVTIFLLLLTLLSPLIGLVGIIVMWFWTKWPKWVKVLITIPYILFFLMMGLILSYLFFIRPFQVRGDAMIPNYKNGAYVIANTVNANSTIYNRGDVIIFKSPIRKTDEYMKRVVGLPGETILLEAGYVYINGQKLDESKYLSPAVLTSAGEFIKEGISITIPENNYFVLGDNRPHSSDSRNMGFIDQSSIIGKVSFCYWNCK